MREFILMALKAVTKPDFILNDLPGSGGRMDLVCRCISNALWISNDLRRDTTIHAVLGGPNDPPRTISFDGKYLRGANPDERNIASHIRIALKRGLDLKLDEEAKVSPGIKIAKRSFETLVKEKSKTVQLIYLHWDGDDIRKFNFKDDVCLITGDHIGLPRKTEKLLDRLGAKKVSIGPRIYLASHVISIVHNELDRRSP